MKMKICLFLAMVVCLIGQGALCQNWHWAKQIGGIENETARSICLDRDGNVYVAGFYYSSPCYFTNDSLQKTGSNDMYVAKYTSSGAEVWVKTFGGNNGPVMEQEEVNAIAYDSVTNSIYIAGNVFGTAVFDNTVLYSLGSGDGFVARLDVNGSVIWVKHAGSGDDDQAQTMTTDNQGTIFVEYTFFNGGYIDTVQVMGGAYLAKYDSSGHCLNVTKLFDGDIQGAEAFYTSISYRERKIFGMGICYRQTIQVDTVELNANFPSRQYFLGCMDVTDSVNFIWLRPIAGKYAGYASLFIDENLNLYSTGAFEDMAFFDGDTVIFPGIYSTLFLAKVDSTGQIIWHSEINATNYSGSSCVVSDNVNGIYVAGYYFGSVSLGNDTLTSGADGNIFILRYDSSGGIIGYIDVAGGGGTGLAVNSIGEVYTCGIFRGNVSFQTVSLNSYGSYDCFVAKSDAITGIIEISPEKAPSLTIFSNPNNGEFWILIPKELQNDKTLSLTLYSSHGQLVRKVLIAKEVEKININLSDRIEGFYMALLNNGERTYSGKIIIE